ncbi:MAG: hypothetical protein ABWY56_09735, partial [Propionibacteriaceae bacterium]
MSSELPPPERSRRRTGGPPWNALLTDAARFPFSAADLDRLEAAGVRVVQVDGHSADELLSVAAEADAVFVYSATIDSEVLRHLTRCRLV